MEATSLLQRSHRNLKAYRQACTLAADVFWLTRRTACAADPVVVGALRGAARAIPEHVARGWTQRHDGGALRRHRQRAQHACQVLRSHVVAARARDLIDDAQLAVVLHRLDELARQLRRLRPERTPHRAQR